VVHIYTSGSSGPKLFGAFDKRAPGFQTAGKKKKLPQVFKHFIHKRVWINLLLNIAAVS